MSNRHAQPRFTITSDWISSVKPQSTLLGHLELDGDKVNLIELRSLQNKAPGLYLTLPASLAGSKAIASTLASARLSGLSWALTRAGESKPSVFRTSLGQAQLAANIQDEILKWHREAWNK